jgi:NAD(P)-dependent dehydrogenase (short-subunit alcohol dehydrogenase family)
MPRLCLVTGANRPRGLGFEVCRQLALKGDHVLLAARTLDAAQKAAALLAAEGLPVTAEAVDVADPASITALAARLKKAGTPLDVLVNNAGLLPSPDRTVLTTPDEDFVTALNVNTLGPLRLARALAPLMRDGGHIVNVSSGMGQLSAMDGVYPAYRISKTALNAVTRVLASELAPRNIKVNSVCPGWVRTDMGGPNAPRDLPEGAASIVWAATLPKDGPTGGSFRDGKPLPW